MTNSTTAFPPSNLPPCEDSLNGSKTERVASRLTGCVRRVDELAQADRDGMYQLLQSYFENTGLSGFEEDLAEKEWAILLYDKETGRLEGFSTLMQMQETIEGRPIVAFFSGDTIIGRDYWGETLLPRLWARHVFGLAEAIRQTSAEDLPVYWFLISSGYKTYRFLPIFFREFDPAPGRLMPIDRKRVMDVLANRKFGAGYDAERGVVCLATPNPLRPDVAALSARRLRDPYVAFFAERNPGHERGDELACLTEIAPTNLTPAGRRMLGLANFDGRVLSE